MLHLTWVVMDHACDFVCVVAYKKKKKKFLVSGTTDFDDHQIQALD